MNQRVSSNKLLFTSSVKSLSPYNKYSIKTLFGRVLIWTNGRDSLETPARRSRNKFLRCREWINDDIDKIWIILRPRSHCSVFIWKRSKTYPFWPCVHIAPLWKRSFSKMLMRTHKFQNSAFWKRSVFSVSTKNGDIWKRCTLLCWKAIHYNGFQTRDLHFSTAGNKGIVLKKVRKQIETKMEQCEQLSFS